MPLSVDQIVNWEYALNPRNEQINRAKKAIESLKKSKKGGSKEKATEPAPVNENFFIEIPPNPYITAKESIQISEKTMDKKNK